MVKRKRMYGTGGWMSFCIIFRRTFWIITFTDVYLLKFASALELGVLG